MSLYSDLLRAALDQERSAGERPIVDLLGDLLARRALVVAAEAGSPSSGPPSSGSPSSGSPASGAADRIGDALAYDLVLARLCECLAIDHGLAGEGPIQVLRWRAEAQLARRLPLVADSRGAAASADGAGGTATRMDPREER